MKRILSFVFAFVLVLLGANTASAQTAQKYPDRFGQDKAACLAALASQQFSPYVPSFMNEHKPLAAGETKRPLEENACVYLKIVGGRKQWVPQLRGTDYVYDKAGRMDRRWDCGNDADDAAYVTITPAPVAPAPVVDSMPRVEMDRIAIDPGPEPEPTDLCPNISGAQQTMPSGMVMDPNGDCVTPAPAYRPEPEAPRRDDDEDGFVLTGGIRQDFGSFTAKYSGAPAPDRGDVTQDHSLMNTVLFGRLEGRFGKNMVFAEGEFPVLGSTSIKTFETITDDAVEKRRDSDDATDKMIRVVGGYGFAINENLTVSGHVGYRSYCVCDDYVYVVPTQTHITYSGMVVGGSLEGGNNRVTIRAGVDYGVGFKRDAWSKQEGFEQHDLGEGEADWLSLRATGEVRVAGPVSILAQAEHVAASGVRQNTFRAREDLSVNVLSVGVAFKWGR